MNGSLYSRASHRGRLHPRILLREGRPFALVAVLAACSVLALADQTMYWGSNFSAVNLTALTGRAAEVTGSATAEIVLTGDLELSADISADARLTGPGGDVLTTEYGLTFDGDGQGTSGREEVPYTSYESFLQPAVRVRHAVGDDLVVVTLHVRCRMPAGSLANAGSYGAKQTLTATWVGP